MSNTAGSDRLRALIVGCGNIAGGYDAERPDGVPPLTHAGAYRTSGLFEIAACVDPDEKRRRAFMERWTVAEGFSDLPSAIAKRPYDVVSVCSPTANHAADLRALLETRPRAVFCEKPVTTDVAETAAIVAAYEAAGIALAVNHTRRWDPVVVEVREKLAAGTWGRLRSVVGLYTKGVLNNGSHLVDLIRSLAGELRLVSTGEPVRDFDEDDPTIPAQLATREGIPVHLCCGHASDYALFELHLVLERGMLSMEEGGFAWRERCAEASPAFPGYKVLGAGARSAGGYEAALRMAVENIYAAITSGAPLSSTGRTALATQQVCDSLVQESGKRR